MTHPEVKRILITPQTMIMALGLALLMVFLYQVRQLITLLLLACMIAAALYPMIERIQQPRLPRRVLILGFYLVFVSLALGFLTLMINLLVNQGQDFALALPQYIDSSIRFLNRLPFFRMEGGILSLLSDNFQALALQASRFIFSTLDFLLVFFREFLNVITVLVLAFFILADAQTLESAVLKLVPPHRRTEVDHFLRDSAEAVGAYVRGQLLVMSSVGVLTALGLYLIGVPYALTLGILAFFLDIIPLIGPILASVLGILIALGKDPMLAVWTALIYLVVQQIEAYVFAPLILGRTVGLHAFWILLSILTGAALAGIEGVLLAVPVAVVMRILIGRLYIAGYLEKQSQHPPSASSE